MTAGLQAVALMAPVVTTNVIFSARRASRGINAMNENPVYGLMNLDIAAGQTLKGGRAALCFSPAAEESVNAAVKTATTTSKFANGVSKVLNTTANYINPIICVASGIKVLGSDDKLDAAARETMALSAMFLGEGAAKRILGMPSVKIVKGKLVSTPREALYKNIPAINNAMKKFENWCVKHNIKGLPGACIGTAFALTSIFTYKFGENLANRILGKKEENKAK